MEQYLVAGVCIIVGVLGWVLPYRWNILRFKKVLASMLSESANQMVPKVVGSILIGVGLLLAVATLAGVQFR